MKKMLALLLVLGLASAASATLQISVNPDPANPLNDYQVTWDPMNPEDSQIVLKPSQTVLLDIHTDAPIIVGEFPTFVLITKVAEGVITGGRYVGPVDGDNIPQYLVDGAANIGATNVPADMEGVGGFVGVLDGDGIMVDPPQVVTLFDEILFHCEMAGTDTDVQLWLINDQNGELMDMVDSVLIHQVPEPMTLGLLGLGGLGLIRRRRS